MGENFLSQEEIDALLGKESQAEEYENGDAEVNEDEEEKSEPKSEEIQETQGTPGKKVMVQKPLLEKLNPNQGNHKPPRNLDMILDVPLEFSVVLGKTKKTIKDILAFRNGTVVELEKLADESLEIYINGKLIARGEVVIINENFGIRITNILSKEERVEHLR